jgi:pyridoxal phosphate-dependent aminotransferase EpsN
LGGEERRFIEEAFDSNWIAPLGPHVDAFEKEVAEFVGTKAACAVSSGTAAIHIALRLLDVQKGDIVFCSSLTFVASASPILYMGAEPVFIDSDSKTWNMSPIALKHAFEDFKKKGKLPKVVIVVNLYGQSADYDEIKAICTKYDVPIIEDAAESLGAIYKGKASGTFGDFGIFSFNGNKIITTSGGGMLVSDNLEAINRARFLATQARDQARHYQHSELGYNYRLSNILAALGRGQLRMLENHIENKRKVYNRYYEKLSEINGIQFMPEAQIGKATRWLTALTLDANTINVSVDKIITALEKENIEARPVWKPLHLQPLFKNNAYYPHSKDKSVSENLFNEGICLPSGSDLTEKDQDRVIKCFKNVIGYK